MTNVIGLLEYYEDLLMMIMMIFLKLIYRTLDLTTWSLLFCANKIGF